MNKITKLMLAASSFALLASASAEEIALKDGDIFNVIPLENETVEKELFEDNGANDIKWIPRLDLPNQQLISNIKALKDMGLLNKELNIKSEEKPWSSSFFPAWYGGASGKWQKDSFSLMMKTMFGSGKHNKKKVLSELTDASTGDWRAKKYINELSATEKYDLITGDYNFTSTRIEMAMRGHHSGAILGKLPKAWDGYCNGASAAGLLHKESFREVQIINHDGHKVTFYPNDIKALLSLAYYNVDGYFRIGDRCNLKESKAKTKDGRIIESSCRDMNPGSLAIALTNRLGIAGTSFVVDKNRFNSVSNHPVSAAKVNVLGAPYKYSKTMFPNASKNTRFLVDVLIEMEIGSTTEKYKATNIKDEHSGRGYYKKVGFKGEALKYKARLELDSQLNIIGGEWTGKKKEAPDFIWFGEKPFTVDPKYTSNIYTHTGDQLKKQVDGYGKLYCGNEDNCVALRVNPAIYWNILKAIYNKSISKSSEVPVLDLRKENIYLPPHSKTSIDLKAQDNLNLTVLTKHYYKNNVSIFAYLSGDDSSKAHKVKVYAYRNAYDKRPKKVGEYKFYKVNYVNKDGKKHFRIYHGIIGSKFKFLKVKFLDKSDKEIATGNLKINQ